MSLVALINSLALKLCLAAKAAVVDVVAKTAVVQYELRIDRNHVVHVLQLHASNRRSVQLRATCQYKSISIYISHRNTYI